MEIVWGDSGNFLVLKGDFWSAPKKRTLRIKNES